MSGTVQEPFQRNPKKQLLEYDKETAKQIVESEIKRESYEFALKLNIGWNEQDILREAKQLSIKVAALKQFEESFESLISEIEGARI